MLKAIRRFFADLTYANAISRNPFGPVSQTKRRA